jgi:DNA-binding protein H-NS
MKLNLKSMSTTELWSLYEGVVSVLAPRISEEKDLLEKKLRRLKAESSPRPYPPVLPKFRNPKRPSETWAGRGKRPKWLSAQLRDGRKLEDFRIVRSF